MVGHTKNGKVMNERNMIARHKRNVLVSMYPTHSVREIADFLGCKPDGLYKYVKSLGLRHTEETVVRIKEIQHKNLEMSHTEESVRKRTMSRMRILREERLRVLSGEKQRTRLIAFKMPSKAYHAKHNLIRRHGYFAFEGERYVIGYDTYTKRVNEEYYKKKYGFKFEEDSLCQEA